MSSGLPSPDFSCTATILIQQGQAPKYNGDRPQIFLYNYAGTPRKTQELVRET